MATKGRFAVVIIKRDWRGVPCIASSRMNLRALVVRLKKSYISTTHAQNFGLETCEKSYINTTQAAGTNNDLERFVATRNTPVLCLFAQPVANREYY